jgi:hypothetical protein
MTGDLASTDIAAQLQRRRAAAVDAWQLQDEIVLVGAGGEIHVPGRADITGPVACWRSIPARDGSTSRRR